MFELRSSCSLEPKFTGILEHMQECCIGIGMQLLLANLWIQETASTLDLTMLSRSEGASERRIEGLPGPVYKNAATVQ